MTRPTDWDKYYDHQSAVSTLTRKITALKIGNIVDHIISIDKAWRPDRIIEIGGANSCFYDYIRDKYRPTQYLVIDSNEKGNDLLKIRAGGDGILRVRNEDILDSAAPRAVADLVFSVGLIEHFDINGTQKAIETHLEMTNSGGYCVITFPTPTLLYKLARRVAEFLKLWIFWDERPLRFDEVVATVVQFADVVQTRINWPIIFTQGIVVAKKR